MTQSFTNLVILKPTDDKDNLFAYFVTVLLMRDSTSSVKQIDHVFSLEAQSYWQCGLLETKSYGAVNITVSQ